MRNKYKKLQDGDSHWYWIPNELVKQFEEWNSIDTESDNFDPSQYDEYRTYGDPNNTPSYWLLKKE